MTIVPANVGINLLTTLCTFLTLPYSEFARHAFGGTVVAIRAARCNGDVQGQPRLSHVHFSSMGSTTEYVHAFRWPLRAGIPHVR